MGKKWISGGQSLTFVGGQHCMKNRQHAIFYWHEFLTVVATTPLCLFLWFRTFPNEPARAWLAFLVPVATSYGIAYIGIVRYRAWRINTKLTVNGMRWHHGFLLGTCTSVFSWITATNTGDSRMTWLPAIVGTASFVGFVNWAYDILAIKRGFLQVRTPEALAGGEPATVATGYAPLFFFIMGACQGTFIIALSAFPQLTAGFTMQVATFLVATTICVMSPMLAYRVWRYAVFQEHHFEVNESGEFPLIGDKKRDCA
jgi:membrane protein YdbS with pleckstrin-like domain